MAQLYTNADELTMLTQPGFFYYRAYGTADAWNKAVFANGASYSPNLEKTPITWDDVGTVREEVSNETVEISLSSGRVLDFDFVYDVTGGLYDKVVVDGTPVAGAEQEVESGAWSFSNVILLENQNGDGSEPTINSVTLGTDGAIVADTDYFTVKLAEVGWGIYIVDSATVTTESQSVTINYDYTPAESVTLTRGGKKVISPIELAFQTVNEDGDYVQYFFYKCFTNGADGHGFSPENSAEPITMDLVWTAQKDTNRTDLDQLYSKKIGESSLG